MQLVNSTGPGVGERTIVPPFSVRGEFSRQNGPSRLAVVSVWPLLPLLSKQMSAEKPSEPDISTASLCVSVVFLPSWTTYCTAFSNSSSVRRTSRAKACRCLTSAARISRTRGFAVFLNASITTGVTSSCRSMIISIFPLCGRLLVEELIYLSRRFRINSRHQSKIWQAGPFDRFQGAKMAQQGALAGGPDPWNFLQSGLADILLAPRAMRADGETVRLVAQSFDEIKQRIARRQLERRAARHEESLAPGVAVGPLGDGNQRHIGHAHFRKCIDRGTQLPLPAVDQHQVGPRLVVALFRLAGEYSRERSVGGEPRVFFQQSFEPPLQHLAQHAVIVARIEIGRADVELAVLVLAETFRPRHHHGADRIAAGDVAIVVDLDAARLARQRECLRHGLEQFLLR